MIMGPLLCITNRRLCSEVFLDRVQQTAEQQPSAIVLREKDISESEYRALAETILPICRAQKVPCLLHTFVSTALDLQPDGFHAPLPVLRQMSSAHKAQFALLGTSCHSLKEVREAQDLGCTYIFAGHIFDTDCKKGVPGRGLTFLQSVCAQTQLPVYAIGGIAPSNLEAVRRAGAAGACVMSGAMQCPDPASYWPALRAAWKQDDF